MGMKKGKNAPNRKTKIGIIIITFELGAITTIGVIQEFVRGQIGSLIISVFAFVFLVFALLELFDFGKETEEK